ncbi:MAG: AIR synthase-related protein [Saprospiraceae bacterium]
MKQLLKYDLRGVSAGKEEVHAAIKDLDKGLYPKAFCKILPDIAGGDDDYCNLMHADTAGTKTSLAYLYWKETGDTSVWAGIAQDAIMMNIDDMACVGCTDKILLSSTIGRNKNLITGEVISVIINAATKIAKQLAEHGVNITLAGGETADVGDVVRTIDVGYTAFARMKRSELVINNVQPGDVIVGFASYGQSTYEDSYNSGIGSNGLTSARHDLLSKYHATTYPDSFDSNTPDEVVYIGSKKMTDTIDVDGQDISVGKLILSPTRTYLPLISEMLKNHHKDINGMIHCTGGGQTKVLKFVENVHIIKDNLLEIPPIFKLIQKEAQTDGREMYQVFNMGHRLEVYTNEAAAQEMIKMGEKWGIKAQIIGQVEAFENGNKLTIKSPIGTYVY